MSINPFWVVWNPNKSAPMRMHNTSELAEQEAVRLAGIQNDEDFFVLQAVKCIIAETKVVDILKEPRSWWPKTGEWYASERHGKLSVGTVKGRHDEGFSNYEVRPFGQLHTVKMYSPDMRAATDIEISNALRLKKDDLVRLWRACPGIAAKVGTTYRVDKMHTTANGDITCLLYDPDAGERTCPYVVGIRYIHLLCCSQ